MQLTTLTFALLTTLTAALPVLSPFNISPRSSHITASSTINTPTTKRACPRVAPLSTPRLNLLNRPDLSPPITQTQTVVFALPSPASALPGPCTLRAVFPPHWEVFDSSLQAGGESLSVNVFAADGSADGSAEGALVGVVKFAAAGAGAGEEERVVTVNAFPCRERMAYRFELAGFGEVGFVNGFDQGLGVEGGLEMGWGC